MVVPATANVEAMVGQAIAGGILDEVNFMALVEQSRRVPGPRGLGGRWDQAEDVYRHCTRRRKSRFLTRGIFPGAICVISSTRYKGDFLDRRITEVEQGAEPNVFVSRRRQYEVQPSRYSGKTFRLLVGTEDRRTRVLGPDEAVPAGGTVENVPVEYRTDFERDPENALRDVVGIATDTISPFIDRPETIVTAIEHGDALGLEPWCDPSDIDLASQNLPQWLEERLPRHRDRPRWAHIDLSLTRDTCGVAIVTLLGHAHHTDPNDSDEDPDTVLTLPEFAVEAAISLRPSPGAEVEITKLRGWLMSLQTQYGLNLRSVTFDGFQSRDSIQVLRRMVRHTYVLSVDRTPEPYEYLRAALYDSRIAMVDSDTARLELTRLEYRRDRQRIDHPPRGSKDVADAICGAVYAASQDRSVRCNTGYISSDGAPTRPRPGQRPRSLSPRPRGGHMRRIKQAMHDRYAKLRAKEDQDFRDRYD